MKIEIRLPVFEIQEFFKLGQYTTGSECPTRKLSDFLDEGVPEVCTIGVNVNLTWLAQKLKKSMPDVFPKLRLSSVPPNIYTYSSNFPDPFVAAYLYLEGDVYARTIIVNGGPGFIVMVQWGGDAYYSPRLTHSQRNIIHDSASRLSRIYRKNEDQGDVRRSCNFTRINTSSKSLPKRVRGMFRQILTSDPLGEVDLVMHWASKTTNIENMVHSNPVVSSQERFLTEVRKLLSKYPTTRAPGLTSGLTPGFPDRGILNLTEILIALNEGSPLPSIDDEVARVASSMRTLTDIYKKSESRYPLIIVRPAQGDYVVVAYRRSGKTSYHIEYDINWIDNETQCQVATLASMQSDGGVPHVGEVKRFDDGLILQVLSCSVDKDVINVRYPQKELCDG